MIKMITLDFISSTFSLFSVPKFPQRTSQKQPNLDKLKVTTKLTATLSPAALLYINTLNFLSYQLAVTW